MKSLSSLKNRFFSFSLGQNQENSFLEKALDKLQLGITITDMLGKIVYCNLAEAQMHGYRVEELIGQNVKIFSPKELWNPDTFSHILKQKSWQRESVNIRKDGSVFPVHLMSDLLLDREDNPIGIITSAEDITKEKQINTIEYLVQISEARAREAELANQELAQEVVGRKKAEAELQETYQTLQALILSSPLAIIMLNPDETVKIWNPAAERIFGWTKKEVLGQKLPIFLNKTQEDIETKEEWDKGFASPKTLQQIRLDDTMETRRKRKDGSSVDVSISTAPLFDSDGYLNGTMAIIADITEHKHAEKQLRDSEKLLRALSMRLQSLQEEERAKIAREVHDEFGQALTALKIDLSWLNQKLSSEQVQLRNKIERMSQLIDTTIQTVRRISTQLRPTILDDLGLVAALEWAVREFQSRTEIECNLVIEPENINVEPGCATTVFRVLQEALTNVARHANAMKVDVSLRFAQGELSLDISDNGRGITELEINNSSSLGLIGIKERVIAWGGKVNIQGRVGEGTTINIKIPVLVVDKNS
ncbi:MAG: PAS domain S-box protein [Acidobacteria bacterium]|nr:PAS domain S-box protein [Acidobacteriota bacterium]